MTPARPPEPATRSGRSRVGQGGFTLVEVLVAFTVLSILLGVVVQAFGGGLRNVRLGAAHTRAVLIAQSRLASLDPRDGPGESSGEAPDGMRWRAALSPWTTPEAEAEDWPVEMYLAEAAVSWGEGDERREVTLRTLRMGPIR